MAGGVMHSITVLSANKIKEITKLHKKKYRDETSLFIAEGYKSLEEMINAKVEIKEIFAQVNFDKEISKFPLTYIKEEQIKKITTTDSPCEVLTIAQKKEPDIKEFKKLNKIILLENISDPGNLGTIIRSAAAFGIEGIILFGNCTELYSPKVIRSTAGNFFKIPVIKLNSIADIKSNFPSHKIIATALCEKNNITIPELKKEEKYLVMFGSEANGLSDELLKISDKNIKLEMKENVESLNLAISASIIMYELINR